MTEFHRKIELQSPDDLQYLVSNLRRAADAEIEKNLPTIEGEPLDPMREKVEELVKAYINTVFTTTSENITINGMDATPDLLKGILENAARPTTSIEEHEPFNAKLFSKAKDLAQQEEDLIEEIAKLRRELPYKVTERTKGAYNALSEEDEGVLAVIGQGETGRGVEIRALERHELVEKNWNLGVKGLAGMVKTLPETVAKKERAERAEGFVGDMK